MKQYALLKIIIVVLILTGFPIASMTCGGGGAQVIDVRHNTISGIVSLPSGVSMSRASGRLSDVDGLTPIESATVQIYFIDSTGEQSGETLSTVQTDDRGYYRAQVESSVQPASNLVAGVTVGSEKMRAFVHSFSYIDINPASEHVVREIINSAYGLSSFENDEIIKIEKYLEQAASDFQFQQYTSVDTAITAFNTGQVATNTTLLIQEMGAGSYSGISCGNGIMESGEECDNGSSNTVFPCTPGEYNSPCTYCKTDCTKIIVEGEHCGDSTIQTSQGEECDDGNTINNDGCDENCLNE